MLPCIGDVKDNEDNTRRRVDIVDASHIDLLLALHVLVSTLVFSHTIRIKVVLCR